MATYNSFNPKHSTKDIKASHTKLLHLASDSIQGGAESVFRNTILQTLQFKNYHIFVASCDNQNNIPKEVKAFVKLDDWGDYPKWRGAFKYVFNFKNYFLLKKFLFTQKPDIIHTQNYLSRLSPSVLFALKAYKKHFPHTKLIYTQHGFGSCANGGFYNYAKKCICEECIGRIKWRIAWKKCDRRGRIHSLLKAIRSLFYQEGFLSEKTLFDKVICVGKFQLQKHKEDGWDISKLLHLTNPIEMTFYNPNVTLQDKQNLIVFYGRLSPEKNVSSLITAFTNLIKYPQFSNYKLLIIGNGDDEKHCIELARELIEHPPSPHYEFLGRRTPKEIKDILSRAKLSVLPSLLQETFGLTIVESMLASCPALVPDISEQNITARHFGGFIFTDLTDSLVQILNEYDTYFNDFMHKRAKKLPTLFDNAYLKELVRIYGGGDNVVYIVILHSFF
ncbi:glycosyltransferase family 4 protein [Helicobacter japonicus]|uniref:glycosyltransferase family 4 protein n=1 Tax=Helicobacter japonicus TaxID=425400 RepID=UPI0023F2ACD4|nr:glycosyltransferase family 4 protein [Helicobacter japonicus]